MGAARRRGEWGAQTGDLSRLRDPEGKPPGVLGWWPSHTTTFLENHDTVPPPPLPGPLPLPLPYAPVSAPPKAARSTCSLRACIAGDSVNTTDEPAYCDLKTFEIIKQMAVGCLCCTILATARAPVFSGTVRTDCAHLCNPGPLVCPPCNL